jgi:hypothetical protein
MFEELSPIEMKKIINNLEVENVKLKQKLVMLFNLASLCMEEDREREVHCNDPNMNEII